jgi:hypothetical protein
MGMSSKQVLVAVLAGILLFGTAAYAWQLTLHDSRGNQYDLNFWANHGGNELYKGTSTNWGYGTPIVRDCITSVRRFGYGINPSVAIMVLNNGVDPAYFLNGKIGEGFTYVEDTGLSAGNVSLKRGPLP